MTREECGPSEEGVIRIHTSTADIGHHGPPESQGRRTLLRQSPNDRRGRSIPYPAGSSRYNSGGKYGTRTHFLATALALQSIDYAYRTYTGTCDDSSVHLSLAPGSGIAAQYYGGQNYGYAQISPLPAWLASKPFRGEILRPTFLINFSCHLSWAAARSYSVD